MIPPSPPFNKFLILPGPLEAKSIPQAQRRDKSSCLSLSLSHAFWYETKAELPVSLEELATHAVRPGCVRFMRDWPWEEDWEEGIVWTDTLRWRTQATFQNQMPCTWACLR